MITAQLLARQIVDLVDRAATTADDKERWQAWQAALMKTLELDGICSERAGTTFREWHERIKKTLEQNRALD